MKDLGLRVGDTFTGPPGLPQVSRAKALPIRLDADGREVSVPYTIRPIRPLFTNSLALKAGVQTLLLLLAWTLLARGNDGPSTLLLAGLMLADSFPEPFTYPGSQYEFLWAWLIMDVLHVIAVALFITFILQTAQPPLSERARRAWHWITFALVSAGIVTKVVPYLLGMVWYSMPNRIFNLGWIVVVFGVAIGLLMHAIRHQRGDDRRRSRWLLVVAGTLASDLVWNGIGVFDLWSWTIWAVLLSVQIAAWLLLMGIVLVQRIVDLRVVLNRAVVYAMVSGAMLIAFALVELFSHNVLHSEGQGLPVLLQTIVAIAGVLVFRKIHHKLDHWVESVLFKRWHQSIVAFKRFEKHASFVTSANVLRDRLRAAVRQFAGAEATLFEAQGDGGYVDAQGRRIGVDDETVVAMRAEGRAQFPAGGSAIAAELVLPMLVHGRLSGFVAIDRRRSGEARGADEIEALERVVGKVALVLASLEVGELQAKNDALVARIRELEATAMPVRNEGIAA